MLGGCHEPPGEDPPDDDDVADDDDGADDDDAADDDDSVPEPDPLPFTSQTGGGAILASEGYGLELFALPVSPVGTTSSSTYRLELGPGAVRAAAAGE